MYLLVGHCLDRARRSGKGRLPTMRNIEQEGYCWARRGIYDQEQAAAYLKEYARRLEGTGPYMTALRLGDRQPVDSELKYLTAWMEQGFPPQTVAMAYDITMLRCGEMKWSYCNGVLKRWHEKGWHTPEQVEQGEQAGKKRAGKSVSPSPRDPRVVKLLDGLASDPEVEHFTYLGAYDEK